MKEITDTLEGFFNAGVEYLVEETATPKFRTKQDNAKIAVVDFHKPENLVAAKQEFKPVTNASFEARQLSDKANNLEELKKAIENFDGCALKKTCIQTVFSDGVENSDIMLIGEAPGANEDEQGIPFCGVSGKLLDGFFNAIDYTREKNLYISNSVFWRPPGNRKPTPAEIETCRPFVEKHIALIKPKILVAVGSTAVSSLMPDLSGSITKIRGQFFKYKNQYLDQEIDFFPIFHPSYLLRQSAKKKIVWDDMITIKNYLRA